ncbi:MAG: ABC transporter permease, partial [Pseudomonadota bacterium]
FEMPKITRYMVVVIQGLIILFAGAMENMFRPQIEDFFRRQVEKRRAAVAQAAE